MHKPKNEFQEKLERQEKARRKAWIIAKEKMIRQRTGITRHNFKLVIHGVPVDHLIGSPVIRRERWLKKPNGTRVHVALLRYLFLGDDGRQYSVCQHQVHETKRGYMQSISYFWGLKPA